LAKQNFSVIKANSQIARVILREPGKGLRCATKVAVIFEPFAFAQGVTGRFACGALHTILGTPTSRIRTRGLFESTVISHRHDGPCKTRVKKLFSGFQ
jgi:hypothetical protein